MRIGTKAGPMMPVGSSDMAKRALSAETTMSEPQHMYQPAPQAPPCTAEMIGLSVSGTR